MEVEATSKGAYSRPNPVLKIIEYNRHKNLPDPLTASSAERIGIAKVTAWQAIHDLQFLGLVTKDGKRTDAFDKMRRASTDEEYQAIYAAVIQDAYKEVFDLIDPAKDDTNAIKNAFRVYEPISQIDRMVVLFLALCRAAGILSPEEAADKKPPAKRVQRTTQNAPKTPRSKNKDAGETQPEDRPLPPPPKNAQANDFFGTLFPPPPPKPDYGLLDALIQRLPKQGQWTEEERQDWVDTFLAALKISVKTKKAEEAKPE